MTDEPHVTADAVTETVRSETGTIRSTEPSGVLPTIGDGLAVSGRETLLC